MASPAFAALASRRSRFRLCARVSTPSVALEDIAEGVVCASLCVVCASLWSRLLNATCQILFIPLAAVVTLNVTFNPAGAQVVHTPPVDTASRHEVERRSRCAQDGLE